MVDGIATRPRKLVICHQGHVNDVGYAENISEFLAGHGIGCDVLLLRGPNVNEELRRCLAQGAELSLLGFNSQLDHAWIGDEPLVLVAARHHVPITQWIFDHPSARWPEFNYSDARTSRFVFHSAYSRDYFARYCCPGAMTTTGGSVGPSWRSRSTAETFDAFSRRPVACLIALSLTRLGRTAADTAAEIEALDPALARILRVAIADARFDLDGPLERHLSAALDASRLTLDNNAFSRCFRLLNDSVQHLRRAEIIRVASRFDVHIQSDDTARTLMAGGRASFRAGVSTPDTLDSMPRCRTALSVSPVNDSIHDRTCNALNAGCVPILEDNRAHRGLFVHGENALLFRYGDDSLAECLALVCGDPSCLYPLAERATPMRDQPAFRFGSFRNIVALAGIDIAPAGQGTQ